MPTMQQRPPLTSLPILLATWFGSGYAAKAPGTVGTLAALPFAIGFAYIGGQNLLLIAALVMSVVGIWVSEQYMASTGVHDPGAVVIDEVVGIWITFLPVAATLTWQIILIGFILFRVFDIFKPWPISWLDQEIAGGLGVMLDDIVAGMFAAAGLYVLAEYAPNILGLG